MTKIPVNHWIKLGYSNLSRIPAQPDMIDINIPKQTFEKQTQIVNIDVSNK